jgi:hypothetical protein
MSFLADALAGQKITHVLADSEVTYLMLANGTQITIRGLIVVQPSQSTSPEPSTAIR